jgi:hypothetical protein
VYCHKSNNRNETHESTLFVEGAHYDEVQPYFDIFQCVSYFIISRVRNDGLTRKQNLKNLQGEMTFLNVHDVIVFEAARTNSTLGRR